MLSEVWIKAVGVLHMFRSFIGRFYHHRHATSTGQYLLKLPHVWIFIAQNKSLLARSLLRGYTMCLPIKLDTP